MLCGYARVSTDGQTLDAQREALKAAGVEKIFEEKASGAKTDRRALARAIKALQPGDTLIVTRLDRLARSTRDLLNTLDAIAQIAAGLRDRDAALLYQPNRLDLQLPTEYPSRHNQPPAS